MPWSCRGCAKSATGSDTDRNGCAISCTSALRGKINQPAHVVHVAEFLAQLKQVDVQTLIAQTTENAQNLFNWHQHLN